MVDIVKYDSKACDCLSLMSICYNQAMVNERSQTQQPTYFLHADGDSFFASCELLLRPDLVGKPVVVGEDRGIAVAMSPEAKKLGVTRGMPVFKIRRQFPSVAILPHHFTLYREVSNKVFAILSSHLEFVERYSIDECFALAKPSEIRFAGSEERLVQAIQSEIRAATGVTYSFGLARTKALANERAALKSTSIDDIWGIGRRTVPRMRQLGFLTAWDFVQRPLEEIERLFSEPVAALHRELSGQVIHHVHHDSDPRDQKSIQSTATFRPSTDDRKIIWAEIAENAESACEHARRLRLTTRSVSFFVKTTDWLYRAADAKLDFFTTDPSTVLGKLEPFFAQALRRGEKIRSTGVILHDLRREEDVPRDLFGRQDEADEHRAIERAGDKIRAKFGRGALKLAASLRGSGKEMDSSFPKG